jgi:transposase
MMTDCTIGVDISKDTLDVHRYPQGEHRQFANTAMGFGSLIKWLAEAPVCRIVFEATGAYHRAFERALGRAGLPLAKVNPLHAKRFGQALGHLAKTDKMDAALLARFGVAIEPQTRPALRQIMYDLKELHIARNALVKDRVAAKNRQKNLSLSALKRQTASRLKQIDKQVTEIDAAIMDIIQGDPELARRFAILISIPGVAERTALALLIDMPELGTLDSQTAAGLSGTAPMVRQSGKRNGKAYVQGGRPQVRQALYMPALVATRFNPDMKAKYDQLKAAGKPSKVAITAIMRKLIVLANALLRDKRMWRQNAA